MVATPRVPLQSDDASHSCPRATARPQTAAIVNQRYGPGHGAFLSRFQSAADIQCVFKLSRTQWKRLESRNCDATGFK